MDHLEREAKLAFLAKLLRVKSCIKELKNERMIPDSIRRLQVAFAEMVKLREVVRDLESMDQVKDQRGAQYQYRRYQLIYTKNYLIESIENTITFLQSQTHVLNTRTCVVSILDDLELASLLFKARATRYVAMKQAKESRIVRKDQVKE